MLTPLLSSTGEKNYDCPDTNKILGPSEALNTEEPCTYSTHDPSLLTKHRKKNHGYIPIPHPRAPSKKTGGFEIIIENIPAALVATRNSTSRSSKSKRARKAKAAVPRTKSTRTRVAGNSGKVKDSSDAEDTALEGSLHSTSRQGADECEGAYVVATDPSSACITNPTSVTPNENMASVTHGQSVDLESLHATGSTTPVAPDQGDALFDLATEIDRRTFPAEWPTSASTTGAYDPTTFNPLWYNPSSNSGINTSAMDGFPMYFGRGNSPGPESWDDLWKR